MSVDDFGALPDGGVVQRITLNGGGLTARILTYGTVLQDLRLQGHAAPLVLGFNEFAPYLTHSPYFGATAGRCANRIRDGHLELGGITYQLDRNFIAKHHLHGGAASLGKRLWQIADVGPDYVALTITLDDDEMGYPGNMQVRVTYRLLPGGALDVSMIATSDADTLCNLAHHSYFNLDGEASIAGHDLRVDADCYLPVDDELIPTGEVRDVAGSPFDFRVAKPVGKASDAGLLDHNFCLSVGRQSLRPVAWLSSKQSGVRLECRTTEPGLQVYDGAKIDVDLPGLTGVSMRAHAGVALEPQIWPDANHHAHFPLAVLRSGETYEQHTQYVFTKEKP